MIVLCAGFVLVKIGTQHYESKEEGGQTSGGGEGFIMMQWLSWLWGKSGSLGHVHQGSAIVQVKDTAKISGSRSGEWGMDSGPFWNSIDANCWCVWTTSLDREGRVWDDRGFKLDWLHGDSVSQNLGCRRRRVLAITLGFRYPKNALWGA